MRLQSFFLRTSLLISAAILSCCYLAPRSFAQSNAQTARITQAVDETQLVRLKGNVHPLARPEFDQGPVADSMPVNRALLLLQRSQEQETALQQLLADQQVKDSPNFHKWLTPQQFGVQFGPADSDIQTVTQWLTGHGFQNVKVGEGRTTIEFSGDVGQVRSAFHTDIHQFNVNGQMHLANVSDPQIPAALSPVIGNVVGLHDFHPKSLRRKVENFSKRIVGKEVTFTCGGTPCFGVAPADFAKIYNVPATVGGNPPGQGVPIAIVQNSNVNASDIQQYRTAFGLTGGAFNIILSGPDPGIQDPTTFSGDETEADLDAELAGGVAPGATVDLVVSQDSNTLGVAGIDLSAIYIINNNLAPIMSESFGTCETPTNGVEPFYALLWQQAAAQGITVIVASGDAGSDVCDGLFTPNDFSTTGLSISAIASTPYNVAVGGTDFQNGANPSTYWAKPGTATESALSYIPESTWNSGCAAGATAATLNSVCTATIINNNTASGFLLDISGGSGGQSSVTANTKPAWQSGITPAADTRRDIPDISLYSAVNTSNNTFYIICEADSGAPQTGTCDPTTANVTLIGGTSAAAPAFAGIMAMVVQQQGGEPKGRQGNANFALYQLYNKNKATATLVCPSNIANVGTTTCIFYDTVTGNNSVACAGGTPNCSNTSTAANQYGVLVDPASTTTPAFTAVAGYDKATGLGSVNVANLLKAWTSATFTADTPSITASPTTTVAHGANASFTVKVTAASGTPSGNIILLATPPAPGTPLGIGTDSNGNPLTLSGGSITFQTNSLPGGANYPVVAQYGGDGTFASGTSTPVNVTVNQETSVTTISLWTFDPGNGLYDIAAPTTVTYGTPLNMRVDVTNTGGPSQSCVANFVPCPTGNVTETFDGGKPLNDFINTQTDVASNVSPLGSQGFLEDQLIFELPGGATHTIAAAYAGDNSYKGSTSNTLSITVNSAPTATAVTANPISGVTTTTAVTLTASIATTSGANGPTGSVTFSAGGSTLGTAPVVPTNASNPNANAANSFAAFGTATLTHTFSTAGTFTVSASYTTGDTNYTGSASSGTGNATVIVTQVQTGSFTIGGTAATVGAGGSSTSTITVTPTGGFTGTVNVTCPTANLPPGVSCTPNPLGINVTGTTAVTGSLTVMVTGPSSTTSASLLSADRKMQWAGLAPLTGGGKGWWGLSAIAGFAAILLVLLPGRKRYRAAFVSALICILSFTLGCGGGYGGGGGTATTTTKLSVTNTKVASGTSVACTVTVTSTGQAPTGMVQLYDGASPVGSPVAVSSGSASITLSSPAVGTHGISAHYLGDTYTSASQSGTLEIAITGSTSFFISASPAASNGNATVNLTIN